MKTELESICDLVRACGEIIKNADRENLHVDAKSGHANFVTEYDKLVQEKLRVGLQEIMPDARFIGEDDIGTIHKRPRHSNSLPFAARKFLR